jgi:MYXO-CTERM domain-containing protein
VIDPNTGGTGGMGGSGVAGMATGGLGGQAMGGGSAGAGTTIAGSSSGGTPPPGGAASDGCGCRVVSSPEPGPRPLLWAVTLLALAGSAARRFRRFDRRRLERATEAG